MKRLSVLMFAVVSLSSLMAEAQIRLPSFENLCRYETDCRKAGRTRNGELEVKPPKPQLIQYYARLRSQIIQIAHQYEIDAVTLVMTPLAENTMNVKVDDKVAELLIDDNGEIAGRALSFGPGQIYLHAARRVEQMAAQIENRPVRKNREIRDALKTPDGALRYAAAIIRDAQNIYGAAGKDISKRPEILATLYNIGKVDRRLRDGRGRDPAPNYFGWWVGYNYRSVQNELRLPSALD